MAIPKGTRRAAAPLGNLMTPVGPCDDHIDRSAPATRAHEPIAPIKNAGPGAILPGYLGGVGLDLVAARLTPHDESDASRSRSGHRSCKIAESSHSPHLPCGLLLGRGAAGSRIRKGRLDELSSKCVTYLTPRDKSPNYFCRAWAEAVHVGNTG
jgi:hypothetical protein